ncbi:tyrosine-protein phosphatase non-receptor type 23-like [Ptychodera flava]|uniref:tyrosine-protein phosphatase non-receptor type 23-like n=1 Tax=Ptychodera flava TaxID=63121 RepID=UPI00396A29DC
MEAVPRMCMLALEMKISPEPTEFTPKIKQFIRDNYQEDPDRYAEEMKQLDQLRVNAVNATRDFNGCSTLRKYYGQLHLLQSRFPMGEGGAIVIPFTWMDIYSEDYITLCDIRYEQASILYNLGGLHSILGAFDKRTSEEGMKVSCTHFQCAAGAFTYLRDHFGSHLSPDLAHDVLSMYINVMLGQAQECLLEKSMQDNRKSSLVARISQQVADYYSLAIRSLDTSAVSAIMGSRKCKDWKKLLQLKNLHYTSIAFMYMGNQVGEQQKYGERVTYMQASLDRHNEALKLSKGQHESITDALKFTTDVIGGKYNAAKKDNDFVYHESVPSLDKMPEIKGASLVKALPFQPYDDSVAGPDIFKKLVPMEAHEAASLYSEEKAKLLREIASEIEERNQQLDQYLASLQLDQLRLQGKEPERLPQALLEKCAAISVKPTAIKDLVDIMQELSNVVLDVDDGIRQLKQVMEEEDRREEEFQKDFGQRSYPLIMTEIKKEISRYEEGHTKASRSNEELRKAMMIHIGNLKLLAGPLEELQVAIPSSQVVSDSPEDKKIEETLQLLINKIEEMKTQRKTLEKQFRDQLNSDDITNLIVTREDSNMQELFQAELKKHETVMTYIQQNLSAQDNILKAVTDANAQYANTRKSSGEAERLREEKIQALIASYDVYDDLQQKSRKGIEFYRKLEAGVSKLLNRLKGIFKVHEEERQQFLSKLPKKVPSRPSAPKPTMPAEPKQPTTSASKPTGLKLSDLIDPSMLGKGNIQAVIAAGPPMPKGVAMGAELGPRMLAGPDDIHPGDLDQYGSLPMEMPGHMPGGYPAPMPRDSTAAGMPPASVHGLPPTSYPSASAASSMNHQPTVPHQGFQPSQHPRQPPVPQAQRPGQPPASMAQPSSQTQQPPRQQMPPPNQPPQPGPPSMQQTMGQHPQPDRPPASDLQPGSLNASPEHFARMPPSSASGPPHIPTSGYNAPGHHPPPASQAPYNQPPSVQRAFPSEISRSSTPPSQIPQSQPYSQPPPSGPTHVPPPMPGAPQSYHPQTSMGPPPPGQYTQQQIQPRDYQQDPGRMDGQPSSLDSNASGASIQGFSHTPGPPPANRSEPPPLQGQQPQIAAAGRQMPYQPQPAQSSGTVNSLQTPIATPKQQGMQQPGLQQHSGHDVTSQVHPAGPSYPQQNLPPQHQPQPHQQQQWQQQLPPHPQQQPWSQQQPPQQQQWQQPIYQQQPVYPQQQQQQPTQQQFPDPSQGRQQPQNQSQPGSMPYQQPYQQHQQLQPPQGGPQQPGMPHQGYSQQQVPGRPQQGQQQGAYPASQSPQHSVEASPHASPQHKQHYQSQQSLPATSQPYVQPQLPVSSQAYPQQQQYPTQPNTGHPQQGQHPQQPWASPVHQTLKGQGQQQWGQQPPQAQQHQQQQPVQQHPPLQPVNPQQPVPQQPSHTQHLSPQQQQQQQQPGHLQQQQPMQQPSMQQHQQPPPQQPQLQTNVQQQQQQLPVHPQQQLAPKHQQPAQQSLQQPYPGQQQWPQKQPQPQPGQQQWQQQPPPPPQQQQQQQQQSNQPASVQQGQQQWPQQQTQWSQQQPYYGQQQQFQSPKHQPYQQQQVPSSQGPMPATSMAQPQQRPPQPNSPHQQVATSQAYQPPGGPYPQMQQPFQQPSSLPLQGQPTFPQQQHQQQPYQPPASSVPDFAREQERLPQPTIQPIKADSVQKPATDLLSISPENKNSPPIQQPALVPNVIKPEPAHTLYEEPKTIPEVKSDPYENKDILDRFVEEVEKFEKHVEGLSKQTLSGPTILDREWKELSECQMKETKQYSISIARCYSMKNRYPDIMPYDHCRVTISSQKDDYINASMLDGLVPTSPRFIVTQAPVPASISDFWLMVYEKQITVIAMLLSDSEADKKFNIYWPAERGVTMQCGQLLLNLQSTRLSSHWTERRINLTHKETRQSRSIIHLQFSSWPEHGLPENANDLVSYISEVHNYYQSQRSLKIPIVVHCSAGVDRSAIFCLTYAAMTEIQFGNGIINIPKMIRFMRNQRKYMIQEKDQLKFCYEAVLFYAEKSLSKRGIFLRKPVTPGVDQQSQGMHSFDFIMGTNSLQDIQSKISQMTVKPRPVVQQPTNENSDSSDLTNQQEEVIADQVVQVMPNDVMQPAANQVAAGDHVMHKSLSRTNSQDSHGSQGVNSYPPSPSKAPLPQPQQNNQIPSGYDSMDSLSSNSSLAASATNSQAQIVQNQGVQNGQEAPKKSTSPSILDNLDPESFTLTASPKQHQKISKASFEERKDALGKDNDPNDPLSLLDPLWTLKDKPK